MEQVGSQQREKDSEAFARRVVAAAVQQDAWNDGGGNGQRAAPGHGHRRGRRQVGHDEGPTGSSPLKSPASRMTAPRRAAPITVARSRICERWWLVGYLSTGRPIGSSVPYGANPFPAESESAPAMYSFTG